MPLRDDPILRFLFSPADLDRIDLATLEVWDEPYRAAPAPGAPYPQALRLRFQVTDPGAGAPQVQPLFPGGMRFVADPAAPGVLPDPLEVDVDDPALYDTWKTLGMLQVTVASTPVAGELDDLAGDLELRPNVLCYAPIRIPWDFLTSALTGMQRQDGIYDAQGSQVVLPTWPDWTSHAVARFLAGTYVPELHLGEDRGSDDVEALPMPTVEMAEDGSVELVVHAMRATDPQDARDAAFDSLAAGTPRTDPAHPRNGAIPARHVYRFYAPHLLDAALAHPVTGTILDDWPTAVGYVPFRFTRTWTPIGNCSVHFPAQVAHVEDAADPGVTLLEQRLPAHGILWLTQPPLVDGELPAQVLVSVSGGMRWLDGRTPDAWRQPGAEEPVVLDPLVAPHVILRRRMHEEMTADTERPAPKGPACTYMSLRRTVRALVDNRVTGGRLVLETLGSTARRPLRSSASTRELLDGAWAGLSATGIAADADVVADCRPSVWADWGSGALEDAQLSLEPVLRALFPEQVPAQFIDNSFTPRNPLDGGQVAYDLWQTLVLQFQCEETKRNFADAHVGRGGPGALASLGLAGYHLDPVPAAGESQEDYVDRIATTMLSGLQPGAVLQFWAYNPGYVDIKDRAVGLIDDEDDPGGDCYTKRPDLQTYGHSPIFDRYLTDEGGTVTGIKVIDQDGTTDFFYTEGVQIHGVLLNVLRAGAFAPEIWIATQWEE